jgi:hypothetical protein
MVRFSRVLLELYRALRVVAVLAREDDPRLMP